MSSVQSRSQQNISEASLNFFSNSFRELVRNPILHRTLSSILRSLSPFIRSSANIKFGSRRYFDHQAMA